MWGGGVIREGCGAVTLLSQAVAVAPTMLWGGGITGNANYEPLSAKPKKLKHFDFWNNTHRRRKSNSNFPHELVKLSMAASWRLQARRLHLPHAPCPSMCGASQGKGCGGPTKGVD